MSTKMSFQEIFAANVKNLMDYHLPYYSVQQVEWEWTSKCRVLIDKTYSNNNNSKSQKNKI